MRERHVLFAMLIFELAIVIAMAMDGLTFLEAFIAFLVLSPNLHFLGFRE